MRRTSLSLAAALTAVLLVSSTPAQAAVSAKDVPRKGDIVKAFPEMADAEFTTFTSKQISLPGDSCGSTTMQKAKSLASIRAVAPSGQPYVQSSAAEVKSATKAKGYVKAYRAYAKECASFTDPASGATISLTVLKAPRLGQSSLMLEQQTALAGAVTYSTSVLIGDGKRVAAVVAIDDAEIPSKGIKQLAKVAASKMR